MKHIGRIAWLIAGSALAGGVLAFAPISGELDPPAGPVADTTPSLADLEAKIDALGANGGALGGSKTIIIAPLDGSDQPTAALLVDGRVRIIRTTAFSAGFALFDGPGGTVQGSGVPINPAQAVHHNYQQILTDGIGIPSQLESDVIVENGLYIGYFTFRIPATILIEYQELD